MYFPRLYPDELTSSLLIRASRHLGIRYDEVVKDLTGSGRRRVHFTNPFALMEIAEATCMTYDDVLANHTLYPYVTAFMTMRRRELIRAGLVETTPQMRSDFDWLAGVPWAHLACRRFCPQCLREDLQQHGESYWHRSHQLPGVYTCTSHRLPLLGTVMPLGWCKPALAGACPADKPGIEISPPLSKHLLDAVASYSKEALEGKLSASLEDVRARVQKVENLGLKCSKGLITHCLSRQLEDFYGSPYLDSVGVTWLNFRTTVEQCPALMVRHGEAITFTTFQHLLLQTFFEHFPARIVRR
ncbi:TniQ protein [Paraburkholderia sp. BL6669N2]|uniref:TniQ family protein n=1 Tax=Paraburkholderia sp. BL6669N2 TaxID=1938807 RepID=UPI000E24EB27|nr:TniQ family protein [Paraburkholderia sp. BL6669N2]REG52088.1 TniQ protein [Paraburkholderia sp. BL6669N2]